MSRLFAESIVKLRLANISIKISIRSELPIGLLIVIGYNSFLKSNKNLVVGMVDRVLTSKNKEFDVMALL